MNHDDKITLAAVAVETALTDALELYDLPDKDMREILVRVLDANGWVYNPLQNVVE